MAAAGEHTSPRCPAVFGDGGVVEAGEDGGDNRRAGRRRTASMHAAPNEEAGGAQNSPQLLSCLSGEEGE
jgi:hypothetical protein